MDPNLGLDLPDVDPSGLDPQNQLMRAFALLHGFLNFKKVNNSEFQALSIGTTHGLRHWSGSQSDPLNKLLFTFEPMDQFLTLKSKSLKFDSPFIGSTYVSGSSINSNGFLAMTKLFASSACFLS